MNTVFVLLLQKSIKNFNYLDNWIFDPSQSHSEKMDRGHMRHKTNPRGETERREAEARRHGAVTHHNNIPDHKVMENYEGVHHGVHLSRKSVGSIINCQMTLQPPRLGQWAQGTNCHFNFVCESKSVLA